MQDTTIDPVTLRAYLPDTLGALHSATPIRMGLSGAQVFAVATDSGELILRIQGSLTDDAFWSQHVAILRRASAQSIAPEVVHIDEAQRATLVRRVSGLPLPAALANPDARMRAMTSVVDQVRALHALDAEGVAERDAIGFARAAWNAQRVRPGFPAWAASLGARIDAIAGMLARDTRRVVSHNDLNPGNILWDGTRAWFIDWEVAGLTHPHFDLATFSTFLDLDSQAALGLLAAQERATIGDEDARTFASLRELVGIMIGCTFLGMAPDLRGVEARTREDTPTLRECYGAMREGRLDLQSPNGQTMFGLALLRGAVRD